ncbi:MAG: tetratricopeptide repeat protein [Planctomycetaceae bacterium]
MQKQNWDYAIQMFGTCVSLKPHLVTYRQTLRGCQRSKYDNNGSGAGTFAKAKLMGIRGRIKKARGKEEWQELDKAAEEGLALNPWDTGLNSDVGEAALKREFMEVAEFAYKTALEADMKSKPLAIQYAELLERIGKYTDAVKVWAVIKKLDPEDMTPDRKMTQLQAKETTTRGGFEDAGSTQDVRKKGDAAAARQGEAAAPGESEEADLKHAIRREPEKIEHYQKLAAYYRRRKQLDDALKLLNKALELSGNDVAYREQVEDVELDMLRQNRDTARELASSDDTARKNWEELEKELVKRELEVYLRREQRYPQDMRLKMDIATRFMQFQKWGEAIPRLQKAAQDVRLEAQARAHMGTCFLKEGKTSLAKGQLERAVATLNSERDPKLFKSTYYNLGRVYEQLGEVENAEKCYGEILVIDYEYKDVKDRLEKLQGGAA